MDYFLEKVQQAPTFTLSKSMSKLGSVFNDQIKQEELKQQSSPQQTASASPSTTPKAPPTSAAAEASALREENAKLKVKLESVERELEQLKQQQQQQQQKATENHHAESDNNSEKERLKEEVKRLEELVELRDHQLKERMDAFDTLLEEVTLLRSQQALALSPKSTSTSLSNQQSLMALKKQLMFGLPGSAQSAGGAGGGNAPEPLPDKKKHLPTNLPPSPPMEIAKDPIMNKQARPSGVSQLAMQSVLTTSDDDLPLTAVLPQSSAPISNLSSATPATDIGRTAFSSAGPMHMPRRKQSFSGERRPALPPPQPVRPLHSAGHDHSSLLQEARRREEGEDYDQDFDVLSTEERNGSENPHHDNEDNVVFHRKDQTAFDENEPDEERVWDGELSPSEQSHAAAIRASHDHHADAQSPASTRARRRMSLQMEPMVVGNREQKGASIRRSMSPTTMARIALLNRPSSSSSAPSQPQPQPPQQQQQQQQDKPQRPMSAARREAFNSSSTNSVVTATTILTRQSASSTQVSAPLPIRKMSTPPPFMGFGDIQGKSTTLTSSTPSKGNNGGLTSSTGSNSSETGGGGGNGSCGGGGSGIAMPSSTSVSATPDLPPIIFSRNNSASYSRKQPVGGAIHSKSPSSVH